MDMGFGARSGTRTRTPVYRAADFKSAASAISPSWRTVRVEVAPDGTLRIYRSLERQVRKISSQITTYPCGWS